MPEPFAIIVWSDGTWKVVPGESAWEYEADVDWLVTITQSALAQEAKITNA